MRMRNFLRAFEEIPAPHLAGYYPRRTYKAFEQPERNVKLQGPYHRLGNFIFDQRRQRRAHANGLANLAPNFDKILEAIRCSLRIYDVRTKKSATAIEFKIEIAPASLRLHKKFDTTVLPHVVEIICAGTADILILHMEHAMNSARVIQQPHQRAWPMIAAFRPKMRNFHRMSPRPR